jgi:hypothetical protein
MFRRSPRPGQCTATPFQPNESTRRPSGNASYMRTLRHSPHRTRCRRRRDMPSSSSAKAPLTTSLCGDQGGIGRRQFAGIEICCSSASAMIVAAAPTRNYLPLPYQIDSSWADAAFGVRHSNGVKFLRPPNYASECPLETVRASDLDRHRSLHSSLYVSLIIYLRKLNPPPTRRAQDVEILSSAAVEFADSYYIFLTGLVPPSTRARDRPSRKPLQLPHRPIKLVARCHSIRIVKQHDALKRNRLLASASSSAISP